MKDSMKDFLKMNLEYQIKNIESRMKVKIELSIIISKKKVFKLLNS